jgi:folylpolyglutamate synthase/dihydropteroate synthase
MVEKMLDIREVYRVPKERVFGKYVKAWQSINKTLNQGGISAPSDVSFKNVMTLYEDLGKPIDTIPCIHVGGTNGKVLKCID